MDYVPLDDKQGAESLAYFLLNKEFIKDFVIIEGKLLTESNEEKEEKEIGFTQA